MPGHKRRPETPTVEVQGQQVPIDFFEQWLPPEMLVAASHGNAAVAEALGMSQGGHGSHEAHEAHESHGGHSPLPGIAVAAEALTGMVEVAHLAAHPLEHLAPAITQENIAAGMAEGAGVGRAMGAVAAPLAIIAGAQEIGHGLHEIHEGNEAEGGLMLAQGGVSVTGGTATAATTLLGAEAVGGAVATAGPAAAALGLGMVGGHAMDGVARDSGAVTHTRTLANSRELDSGTHEETTNLGMSDLLTRRMLDIEESTGSQGLALLGGGLASIVSPLLWLDEASKGWFGGDD